MSSSRREMLDDVKLVSRLPDKGQKIRDKLVVLEVRTHSTLNLRQQFICSSSLAPHPLASRWITINHGVQLLCALLMVSGLCELEMSQPFISM